MPLYDIECKQCGSRAEVFRKIKDYDDLPKCCGEKMTRMICAPYVPQEFQPYKSMIDGRMITDRGEHRRHLKNNGCVEVGNEPVKPIKKTVDKREKDALRVDISQRLEAART